MIVIQETRKELMKNVRVLFFLDRYHDPTFLFGLVLWKKVFIPSFWVFVSFLFQIFIYNLESNDDNHLEHIHGRKKLLPILADPRAADLFCWAGLAQAIG